MVQMVPAQLNAGEEEDTKFTPVGKVLLTVRGCDGCGPMLLTVMV